MGEGEIRENVNSRAAGRKAVPQTQSQITRLVELIASAPYFYLLGAARGKIVFFSNLDATPGIWALDPKLGERRKLTKGPVHSFAQARKESREVVFTRDVSKGKELQVPFVTAVDEAEERQIADVPPARVLGISFQGGRVAYIGATAEEVALFQVGLDGSWEKLAKFETMAFLTDFNGDYAVGYGTLAGRPGTFELFILDTRSRELRVYTPKPGSSNTNPTLRGSKLLFESDFEGRKRLYTYDAESGDLQRVSFTHRDYDAFNPVEHLDFGWLDDGRVWVIAKRDGRTQLFIDGKRVRTPRGVVSTFAELDGKFYFTASSLTSPPQVYELDPQSGASRVAVASRLPRSITREFGRSYFTRYPSFDGRRIPAFVVENARAPRPGPTVVYVHGGPWSEVMDSWDPFIASLVASGFHVVAPNYRGSTGYGEDFRRLDIGDPGGGDLNDIAHAGKWALSRRLASRLAIMGYSYGGYSTLLALGRQPDLWKAGVAGASVADWEDMKALSDAYFRSFIDTLFDGKTELLRERSPITYVDKVTAPLCIIHPANDTRTPLKPVLRYIQRLSERGAVFEAHILPDMGHYVAGTEERVRVIAPAIHFLKKYFQ
ncbi:S9 family peptidase [Infirmifilum sp. SLHALR2]|nr:MAG: hypothetical protein B7L53_00055 [Thermofilum sp. NZ13]